MDWGWDREFWLELQTLDLADSVGGAWDDVEAIEPWLVLWNNHDIREVKTHPLLFRMGVGGGVLNVSYLPYDGTNPSREAVLQQWIGQALRVGLGEAAAAAGPRNLERLAGELGQRELRLDDEPWRFQVDSERIGRERGWQMREWNDTEWSTLSIDRHWDGQGFPNLDGWAWYRRTITLPDDWNSERTYLSFTGVDDHYRAYVNGELVGTGGDIETRSTAFEERKSHDISRLVKPGETITIAVEVYDWYGAGGIFRPVSITATPIGSERPWLVRP